MHAATLRLTGIVHPYTHYILWYSVILKVIRPETPFNLRSSASPLRFWRSSGLVINVATLIARRAVAMSPWKFGYHWVVFLPIYLPAYKFYLHLWSALRKDAIALAVIFLVVWNYVHTCISYKSTYWLNFSLVRRVLANFRLAQPFLITTRVRLEAVPSAIPNFHYKSARSPARELGPKTAKSSRTPKNAPETPKWADTVPNRLVSPNIDSAYIKHQPTIKPSIQRSLSYLHGSENPAAHLRMVRTWRVAS